MLNFDHLHRLSPRNEFDSLSNLHLYYFLIISKKSQLTENIPNWGWSITDQSVPEFGGDVPAASNKYSFKIHENPAISIGCSKMFPARNSVGSQPFEHWLKLGRPNKPVREYLQFENDFEDVINVMNISTLTLSDLENLSHWFFICFTFSCESLSSQNI